MDQPTLDVRRAAVLLSRSLQLIREVLELRRGLMAMVLLIRDLSTLAAPATIEY
jgi:hypothetical protein